MATRDLQNIVVIIVLNLHIVYLVAFSLSQGKLIDFGKTDINSVKCAPFISSYSVTLCFQRWIYTEVGESGCNGVILLV